MENKIKENLGKMGCSCPFNNNLLCGAECGLFVKGINSCVFHAINMNLGSADKRLFGISLNTEKIVDTISDKGFNILVKQDSK